ncbi:hypothetical protein MSUIS_05280 [Mycoplasma suis KI3806]|uniref:Uncharacterized protein n=1 Tax=Mycoplasma suis (strain KI_3806) TaxID=708248 RepID=F0V1U0_MYCS3|nr:hypothetical protein [Mycoplasma suis]CBZ40621.1 hypothetical protein MSUIS_05280 [Mycoplasma suis KI3806]
MKANLALLTIFSVGGGSTPLIISSSPSSWFSSQSSTSFAGGALNKGDFEVKGEKSLNFEGHSVEKLETKELSQLSESTTSSIKIEEVKSTEIPETKLIVEEKRSASSPIQEIFEAINREKKVNEFNVQREAISLEAKKKLTSPENFKNAFQVLKTNDKFSSEASEDNVEETSDSISAYFLEKEGRESLQTYFEEYLSIKEKQENLNGNFDSSLGNTSESGRRRRSTEISFDKEKAKKLVGALKTINWTVSGLDWGPLFTKYKEKSFSDTDNPFGILFENEEEWKGWASRIEKAKKDKQDYMDTKRLCGLTIYWFTGDSTCYPDLPKYQKKIKRAEASAEVLIGRRLLRIMNQLQ